MTGFLVAGATVFGAVALGMVVSGALHDVVAERRRRHRFAVARLLTTVLFGEPDEADRASRRLMRERRSTVLAALQELAVDLQGQALGRTRHLVDVLGIATHIAALSRSRRRTARIRAAELISLSPDSAAATRLLEDRDPLIRALTAESLGGRELAGHPGTIGRLLRDRARVVSATAQDAMIRSGEGIDDLETALTEEPTIDAALMVVAHVPDPKVVPLALRHIDSPSPARRALVARALGTMAGPDVSAHLAALLDDEDPEVREAAVRSVGTAGRGELAAALGRALSDPSWTVRHAAGEALSRFGPLGSMVLYAHLDDPDPYASDMALRFVDLVEEGGGSWGRTVHVGFAGMDQP